jgi:3-methyladenine DNA glycosylase AlkD
MPVAKKKSPVRNGKSLAFTAKNFLSRLTSIPQGKAIDNSKFLKDTDDWSKTMGVRMATIFKLAKEFKEMALEEIVKLLDSDFYEARMGAVSIMDFQARDKKITRERHKQLYNLYLNKHDRINNWDLVDRSAPYVVGGYLFDKPRTPLYKLAKSKNIWKRRTSIVATYFFIRQNDINDTFKIAEMLVQDKEDLINKAVGSWVREAGKRDHQMLIGFLDKYAATMPRVTLRYAIEKLDKKTKEFYLKGGGK